MNSTCSSLEVISELPSGREKKEVVKEKLSRIEESEMVSIDLEGSILHDSENEAVAKRSFPQASWIIVVFQCTVFIISMVILAKMGSSATGSYI